MKSRRSFLQSLFAACGMSVLLKLDAEEIKLEPKQAGPIMGLLSMQSVPAYWSGNFRRKIFYDYGIKEDNSDFL